MEDPKLPIRTSTRTESAAAIAVAMLAQRLAARGLLDIREYERSLNELSDVLTERGAPEHMRSEFSTITRLLALVSQGSEENNGQSDTPASTANS